MNKDNELDEMYMNYSKAVHEKLEAEDKANNLIKLVNDLKKDIKDKDAKGEYGLSITSHACISIMRRLEDLSKESSIIFQDVFNPSEPRKSLMWPSNMEAFIFSTLAKARIDKSFTIENSKNSSGLEYHYNVEIKNWSNRDKRLVFTGLVENNNVKTGFFNWVQ